MIFTIEQLRTYARSIDNRLEDVDKYPDAWLDYRIEEGLAIAQEIKQIFYTKERYDLTANIDVDGLTEMEIILQKEPYAVPYVECELSYYDITITPNNHVIVKVKDNAPIPDDRTVTVRYFFYHTLPITEIEMTMEMYRLCKYSISAACFDFLHDEESEQYNMAKAESMVVKGTFDLEKDLMSIPEDRLWNNSWA